ncbi:MAG: hypothetical protein QOE97_1106 [Pseudonocardiales bacterium]|jgi:hypothetical protein|nr:hypothetical protein [Pseudonocardiales bacterium]
MAQRKSPPPTTGKRTGSGGTSPRPGTARPGAGGRPPAKRKPGTSIVNQRQTPWGLIITTLVIVLFAAGIVIYVVANKKSSPSANQPSAMIGSNATSYLNELKAASTIQGVTFKPEADRNHVNGTVKYDSTPPVGGNHSPYWADCAGTVYPAAIANENAVHMLEHGAVWITYKPGLATSEVTALSALVNGQDRMAMSPYPNLDAPISLQSWGYQLKVNSASDPRIQQFIDALRYNKNTTPEYGATCSQPTFKTHPSTFGNPLAQPAA